MNEESKQLEARPKKRKKVQLPKLRSVLLGLLVVAVLGFGLWQFMENQKLKTPEGQQQLSAEQINNTIAKTSKHILLPTDEQPVIATVNDPEALKKDQNFYKEAQKGDQVLVYQKNQRAIIYSPSRDVIVNVGGVSITGTPTSTQASKNP